MYVYAIETPAYVKIGHWSGSISALRARYATSIPFFEITVFQTYHSVDAEKKLHRECHPFHLRGEMFSRDALPVFYSAAASLGEIFCTSTDLEKKKAACLKAQNKKLHKENAVLRKANEKLSARIAQLEQHRVDVGKRNTKICNVNSEHRAKIIHLQRTTERLRVLYHNALDEITCLRRANAQNERRNEMDIDAALQEQRVENSPFDIWLDDNLILAPDARIHVHRFERAYNAGNREANRIRMSHVIRKLTERGHIVSDPNEKQKDAGCCAGSGRWVKHVNVLGYGCQ